MKIGVISDSHYAVDVANSALDYLRNLGIDLLIHAGDIVELRTLQLMHAMKIPYAAVIGNNDTNLVQYKKNFNLFEQPHKFAFGGLNFKLMHHPFYLNHDADVVIYGHTHYFAAIRENGTLFLNPGEICGRKKPLFEFAYIEAEGRNLRVFKVESPRQITPSWQKTEINLDQIS